MMKEEFEKLFNVSVSDNFYDYIVEPMYANSKMSKQAFASILNRDMVQKRAQQFDDILSGKKQSDEITTKSGYAVFDEYKIDILKEKQKTE